MLPTLLAYNKFTSFTPTLPQFYWNVYSSEQRIKRICKELYKLACYADYLRSSIDDIGEDVEDYVNDALAQVEEAQSKLRKEMLDMLAQIEIGDLQWDVQQGNFVDSVQAQRDMFNDITVHSYNLEQLDEVFDKLSMDVDGLANCGLNVKGFAVVNHYLLDPKGITSDNIYDNKQTRNALTVNDLSETKLDLDGYLYVTT